MRTIEYIHVNINSHCFYLGKEKGAYVFVGSEGKAFDEIYHFFGGKNITYVKGDEKDFQEAIKQFEAYYSGELRKFDLPIAYSGTPFQIAVWEELQHIPYGETITYKQLAKILKKEKAVRAIASAVGKNPLLVLIPCHRVLGSDGKLRGYRGGLGIKQALLAQEQG